MTIRECLKLNSMYDAVHIRKQVEQDECWDDVMQSIRGCGGNRATTPWRQHKIEGPNSKFDWFNELLLAT